MIFTLEKKKLMLQRLRQQLRPSAIYLFGSQASGQADPTESDVDLLVVVPDDAESCLAKSQRAYHVLRDLPFPKDVIVRHQAVFQEKIGWSNSIEREIYEKGQLIFSE